MYIPHSIKANTYGLPSTNILSILPVYSENVSLKKVDGFAYAEHMSSKFQKKGGYQE